MTLEPNQDVILWLLVLGNTYLSFTGTRNVLRWVADLPRQVRAFLLQNFDMQRLPTAGLYLAALILSKAMPLL
jgi:hypothetical protein